jgi:4-hydroxybenzoate polyprenyltransferase
MGEVRAAGDYGAGMRPLVMDAERALQQSGQLPEAILAYIRPNPFRLLRVIWWRAQGRSHLSRQIATAVELSRIPNGFDYVDKLQADSSAWHRTQKKVLVDVSAPLEQQTAHTASCPASPSSMLAELLISLRPLQWVKNLLVFVPIVLAGQLVDPSALTNTLLAFVAIGLVASATYLVNDMWDLADDRLHWSKRHRPLASGRLPISIAALVAPIAILVGLLIGASVSAHVAGFLTLYLVVTLVYSFGLKRIPLLDGIVLATLYTIRLVVGIAAANVRPSPWLLIFSMFLFASLAYAKRHTEIERINERNGNVINGRGYRAVDAPLVLAVGVAAGIGAVLIMVLYIIEDAFVQTFYANTIGLWALPPLVFLLISRIWLKSHRKELNDDPVDFALRDPVSLTFAGLMALSFIFAWFVPNWN